MSDAGPEPEQLFAKLRDAAPPPPLPSLVVPEPTRSLRPAPIGPLITGARRSILKIIAPALVELIGQLERERHQQRATIADLQERISHLEQAAPSDRS